MTYATQQDLIDRFGNTEIAQLTDRDGDGAIDTVVVDQALLDADQVIDGYLQSRHALPLPNVPQVLVTYACDIARYRLYDERATEQVRRRYEDALKFLQMVGQGKVSLGLDAAGEAAPSAGGPSIAAPDPVFTQESLQDY